MEYTHSEDFDKYLASEWRQFLDNPDHARFLLEVLETRRLERVLDLGCGAGQELIPFLRQGALGIGLDPERKATIMGRKLFAEYSLCQPAHFVQGQAESLPFKGAAFDLVICRLALPYTDNLRALREIARVLEQKGTLILKIHHPRYYLGKLLRAISGGNLLSGIHACRVLLAGTIYRVSGKQRWRRLVGNETFQTAHLLRKELRSVGMKIVCELPDTNPSTPSFLIRKD